MKNPYLQSTRTVLIFFLMSGAISCNAAEFSKTEAHFQYGNLEAPSFLGGESADTFILTLQHFSRWQLGTNYFFVDFINDNNNDNYNNSTSYLEWYSALSLGKVMSKDFRFGFVKDVGILAGINFAPEPKLIKYLPGVRFSLDVPGFTAMNLDLMGYLDASSGLDGGGAPKQDNSWMIDLNFALPFQFNERHRFSFEGHMEYVRKRTNELGGEVASWFFLQPQIRYDLGNGLGLPKDRLFTGLELHYWQNKLGEPDTDERTALLLMVWRF